MNTIKIIAAIVILAIGGGYVYVNQKQEQPIQPSSGFAKQPTVQPGTIHSSDAYSDSPDRMNNLRRHRD